MKSNVKCIAFYLPQYHEIAENNQWWGKGFTEWTNVKNGKPLYKGHYQPKVPLGNNYYCLMDENTLKWQGDLAQKYDIYGFCYYHYWFKNGKKLLEQPSEIMLKSKKINQKFCFCWANENWARTWDGGDNEVIMPQEYGGKKEWEEHLNYLTPFFKDERYIKIDGKPLFIIYRPDIIPYLDKMLAFWKKRIKGIGFDDLYIMSQHPTGYFSVRYDSSRISKFIMFEPQYTRSLLQGKDIKKTMKRRMIYKFAHAMKLHNLLNFLYKLGKQDRFIPSNVFEAEINDYDEYWSSILNRNWCDPKLIPGAFVNWDNIARKRNGMLFKNASPEKFKKYLTSLVKNCEEQGQEFLFINAWNEWGEGAYLEPDEKYGYAYLEAVKSALEEQ